MSRINSSVLWDYFDKIDGTKRAVCRLCDEEYSYCTTTANLKSHLKKKHELAYIAVNEAQEQAKLMQNDSSNGGKERVIYEYVVAASPSSSISNEPTPARKTAKILRKDAQPANSQRQHRISQHSAGKAKEKRLIEQLTKEKISVTITQNELLKKELAEKNLKLLLLQQDMEHKKLLFEFEKQELEHKKQEIAHRKEMNELEKQEMLLKIEVLRASLASKKETNSSTAE